MCYRPCRSIYYNDVIRCTDLDFTPRLSVNRGPGLGCVRGRSSVRIPYAPPASHHADLHQRPCGRARLGPAFSPGPTPNDFWNAAHGRGTVHTAVRLPLEPYERREVGSDSTPSLRRGWRSWWSARRCCSAASAAWSRARRTASGTRRRVPGARDRLDPGVGDGGLEHRPLGRCRGPVDHNLFLPFAGWLRHLDQQGGLGDHPDLATGAGPRGAPDR